MNKVCLIGRLTAKPELRYTNGSNIPTTRFSLAVKRSFTSNTNQPDTDFISVVVWNKQAENVCQYLDKGSLVAVEGRIQTGSYDDKDGKKVYTTDVVANNVSFLESKAQSQNRASSDMPVSTPTNNVSVENDPFADFGDSVAIDDNFLE